MNCATILWLAWWCILCLVSVRVSGGRAEIAMTFDELPPNGSEITSSAVPNISRVNLNALSYEHSVLEVEHSLLHRSTSFSVGSLFSTKAAGPPSEERMKLDLSRDIRCLVRIRTNKQCRQKLESVDDLNDDNIYMVKCGILQTPSPRRTIKMPDVCQRHAHGDSIDHVCCTKDAENCCDWSNTTPSLLLLAGCVPLLFGWCYSCWLVATHDAS
eukprot:TRINITY_DN55191_c0_g1_i1.p1 TRINITY_DN55191_c0_g1~~TRINITY_DN55191_c0_g1_i1.p1  ORF type:complete len:214 (-),score=7.40 TRINITY_DN55191_c0_g1_i1:51-692(-)